MVIGMDHLVGHRVLQMPLVLHFVGANPDTVLRIETTGLPIGASPAVDVVARKVPTKLLDAVAPVTYHGA